MDDDDDSVSRVLLADSEGFPILHNGQPSPGELFFLNPLSGVGTQPCGKIPQRNPRSPPKQASGSLKDHWCTRGRAQRRPKVPLASALEALQPLDLLLASYAHNAATQAARVAL